MSVTAPRHLLNTNRVHRRLLADYHTPAAHIAPYKELDIQQISDIKYHEPSNHVLATSRSPSQDVVIWAFAPKQTDETDRRPRLLLGWSSRPLSLIIASTLKLSRHCSMSLCLPLDHPTTSTPSQFLTSLNNTLTLLQTAITYTGRLVLLVTADATIIKPTQ
jgi:hypothetical protein